MSAVAPANDPLAGATAVAGDMSATFSQTTPVAASAISGSFLTLSEVSPDAVAVSDSQGNTYSREPDGTWRAHLIKGLNYGTDTFTVTLPVVPDSPDVHITRNEDGTSTTTWEVSLAGIRLAFTTGDLVNAVAAAAAASIIRTGSDSEADEALTNLYEELADA